MIADASTTHVAKIVSVIIALALVVPSVSIWTLGAGEVEQNVTLYQIGFSIAQVLIFLFYFALLGAITFSRQSYISRAEWLWRNEAFLILSSIDFSFVVLLPFVFLSPGAKYSQSLPSATGYILLVLVVYVLSFLVRYFTLSAFGHRYVALQGISLNGVGALALLAQVQLQARSRLGIVTLRQSLRMADAYLASNGMRLKLTGDVLATLFTLDTYKQVPFPELTELAHAMSLFPDLQRMSDSMSTFLRSLGWPSAIVSVDVPKKSNYEKLAVLAAVLAGLGTFLPETYRQGLTNTILSSTALTVAIALSLGLFSFLMLRRLALSAVDPFEMVRYWKRLRQVDVQH